MITWCDSIEAKALTNVNVSPTELSNAQPVIDMFSGRTVDQLLKISAWNVKMLKFALVYQARWMSDQIDSTNRLDIENINQDGVSMTLRSPDSMILAPHARVCLNRLTWMGNRTLTAKPSSRLRRYDGSALLEDEAYMTGYWKRI